MDMNVAAVLRLLGDEIRLRLLRLVGRERLNVSELTAILGLAQSGVSRHLGLLRDAGLVREEREGAFAYYRIAAPDERTLSVWPAVETAVAAAKDEADAVADEARLQEILRLRKERFETHGTEEGQLVPGRSWAAWARALGHLLPPLDVADVGCGDGYLTVEAAQWARRVIAVDRSAVVLERARELADRRHVSNIVWRQGELEDVPIDDSAVDVVLLSQALHHASDPGRALEEAARVLRPGGRLLVLDLRAHDQEWVRGRLGDTWLGFTEERLTTLLGRAGFDAVRVQTGARRAGDPFVVLVASGVRPDGAWRAAAPRARSSVDWRAPEGNTATTSANARSRRGTAPDRRRPSTPVIAHRRRS